jgi:hypothetical protein
MEQQKILQKKLALRKKDAKNVAQFFRCKARLNAGERRPVLRDEAVVRARRVNLTNREN